MKTFLVKNRNNAVVINHKSYYYKNIISVKDDDKETLDYCQFLLDDKQIEPFEFILPKDIETNNKKDSKSKKDEIEDKDNTSKVKTTKSKAKTNNKDKKEEK